MHPFAGRRIALKSLRGEVDTAPPAGYAAVSNMATVAESALELVRGDCVAGGADRMGTLADRRAVLTKLCMQHIGRDRILDRSWLVYEAARDQ